MACIFGDVRKIETSGASDETAMKHELPSKGVEASHELAKQDKEKMKQYRDIIIKVGKAQKMDPAVIAGIISRESRAGENLVGGWDDREICFGLMQVNTHKHTPKGAWDSKEHLTQGTEILIQSIKAIQKKFPEWTKEEQFKGGISAYDAGPGNVCSYECMDIGTTGDDYGNDVVARAQWYKRHDY